MTGVTPDLRIRTFERTDGSVWRQYETDGYRILLTSAGRHLFTRRHMFKLLCSYVDDYLEQREDVDSSRRFLAGGGNARIFSVADDLVIKESRPGSGSSLFASMDRMDRLVDAVQKHCPRWIDIPTHYGAAISKNDIRKQFMLEQKIDHGVTVGDVVCIGEPNRATAGDLAADSLAKFGPVSPELAKEITGKFADLGGYLTEAVQAEGLDPERFLPDIVNRPYNVVLDRLDTPEAGSYFKYWVIDQ